MQDYVERYQRYCADLNVGFRKQDIKRHNLAMNKLRRLFNTIQNVEDKSFLLKIMYSAENDWERLIVSSHCLRLNVYIKDAIHMLETLSKYSEIVDVSLDAEQILRLFEKKELL